MLDPDVRALQLPLPFDPPVTSKTPHQLIMGGYAFLMSEAGELAQQSRRAMQEIADHYGIRTEREEC